MRIIYDNALYRCSTITASTTDSGFNVENLKNNYKSMVHRSSSHTVTYTLNWTTAETITGVALPATNLVDGSTISINGAAATTACLGRTVKFTDGSTQPTYKHFAFGGATKTSFWFSSPITVTQLSIVLNLPTSSGKIDCSTIVCGKAWHSSRTASNGITIGTEDSSQVSLTRTGNTYIDRRFINETMNFNLQYINDDDRRELLHILRTWGTSGFIYVCVFPDNTNPELTQTYSIYGRNTNSQIEYAIHSLYNTSLNITGW